MFPEIIGTELPMSYQNFCLHASIPLVKIPVVSTKTTFQVYSESPDVHRNVVAEIAVLSIIEHKYILKFIEGFKGV